MVITAAIVVFCCCLALLFFPILFILFYIFIAITWSVLTRMGIYPFDKCMNKLYTYVHTGVKSKGRKKYHLMKLALKTAVMF